MLDAIAQWWESIELWLAQLPFPLQFGLVMAVLLLAGLGAARLIDRLVDNASSRFNPPPSVEVEATSEVEPGKVDAGTGS